MSITTPDHPSRPLLIIQLASFPPWCVPFQVLLAAGVFLLSEDNGDGFRGQNQMLCGSLSDRGRFLDSDGASYLGAPAPAPEHIAPETSSKTQPLKPTIAHKDVIDSITDLDEKALGRAVARAARVEEPAHLLLITIQAAISVMQVLAPLMIGDCQLLPLTAFGFRRCCDAEGPQVLRDGAGQG